MPRLMELTQAAQIIRDEFEFMYGEGGRCSCHINPPCNSCIHPGNPANQEEDEDSWRKE